MQNQSCTNIINNNLIRAVCLKIFICFVAWSKFLTWKFLCDRPTQKKWGWTYLETLFATFTSTEIHWPQISHAFKCLACESLVCYWAVVPNGQPFFSVEHKTFIIVAKSHFWRKKTQIYLGLSYIKKNIYFLMLS